ncbi:epoxide hydrolase [Diaporthe eres]|uniref:Epoxide hydrolase N-terminal domain-containing protein n=2 Tax=Diaporthe vaccinii TaxID=105482 RepID=A0ABR4EBF8_9PEZI|nr:epoxide hydrolase [Diaporthe eres]
MADTEEAPPVASGDEIKPYKIHVSSRYLDLTKQKLELTRLPHESTQPPSEDWWEPKPQVEPLIDFWLEKYSWREQEETLNKTPQFRTAISTPSSEAPLRLHFIHAPSPHSHALPLLLIPPFPFSNLALAHLVKPFTEPEDASQDQPFHLVIPALPGLGFSDPFPNNTPVIPATAEMLNTLMLRLGYQHYLVSNSGAAQSSPARIDWKLVESLSSGYPGACLGAHLISPPLCSPKLSEAPLEWAKWTIANVLNAPILGYSKEDLSAHKQATVALAQKKKALTPSEFGLNSVGLKEPNTLAYAMCDSPTGLLVFALKGLRLLAPRLPFTPEQIITFTNLAWLPGPEYAMRFWAHCATHDSDDNNARKEAAKKPATRPRVGITVFLGEAETGGEGGGTDTAALPEANERTVQVEAPTKVDAGAGYVCPAWANAHYSVLFSQRAHGVPGLLAWERPHVILTGLRGLAAEVLKADGRLRASPAEGDTVPLEGVVSPGDEAAGAGGEGGDGGGLQPPQRPVLEQGDSSRTQVASQPPSSPKGKEPEMASPITAAAADQDRNPGSPWAPVKDGEEEERSIREGTPDTVILVTAPKEDEDAR